jgi:hypothetical protein
MRATRLSVANYNTTLSSDSLESGTGSSNSLRSANESSGSEIFGGISRIRPHCAQNLLDEWTFSV